MKAIQTFFAWVCAILFVVTGVLALLLLNIEPKAFAPETYKQAFEKQNLYERMPAILATALYTSLAQDVNTVSYLKALKVEDWETIITNLLPPEELKSLTDDAVNSVFDYLNNKSDSASISFLPLKKHFTGPQGVKAVRQILTLQPDCTPEQLMQMGLGLLEGKIILCNPPEEMMGLVTPLIESQLQGMTVAIPDEIALISNAKSGTPDDPRLKLNTIRLVMRLTPVLPILFLIGILILVVRSLTEWLDWWGWPFLITGSTCAIIAMLGLPVLGLVIQKVMQGQGAGFIPPILFSTLRETISAVSMQILKPAIVEGMILGIFGLGMVVAAYVVKKSNR